MNIFKRKPKTEMNWRYGPKVTLIDHMGSDAGICRAARVSNLAVGAQDTEESEKLISYLMTSGHGSPFEHTSLQFLIEQDSSAWEEFFRHRIGFSYNKESSRWRQLTPTFYLPPSHRPLVQVGRVGEYRFEEGSSDQLLDARKALMKTSRRGYRDYERQLSKGVAKEVARFALPANLVTAAYVTCNVRSLLNFLELRLDPTAKFEIRETAAAMKSLAYPLFPLSIEAWEDAGRVAP